MPASVDTHPSGDPYLSGHYAPVADELVVDELRVTGEIPPALRGSYLRNGPNPQFPPLGAYHLFDGDGMLHAVTIEGGRARYRNRWIESAGLLAERRAGHALFGGLSDFRLPEPEVLAEVGPLKNTANTHVVRHGGRILALLEAAKPTEVTEELATVGEWDFDGRLAGAMTAHPKTDPETGELVFFGYGPFPPYLRYHVADAAGTLTTSVDIDLPAPVMIHDFAVSRDRVVFFDLPAVFDLPTMLAGGEGIRWEPANGARIGVLDRRRPHDEVRWIEVEPFWMFHVLNAHDDGDAVVVEGCRVDRLNTSFGPRALGEPVRPHLHRWRIDAAAGVVTDEALDDRPTDFPRLNDGFAGLPARYGYVGHTRSWAEVEVEFDGITKHDLAAGTSTTHHLGAGCVAGEAVFAPDPDRAAEDAGWLLTFVHDRALDASHLAIVDAQGMAEVARVHLPRRVPFGFHGSWLAAG